MGIYTYKVVDSRGKTIKGELEAKDELDLSTQLAKLGYLPISISFKGEKAPPLLARFFRKRFKKVSTQALIVFTRQFATIVKATVPILEGLNVLAEQADDASLKDAVAQVIQDVEGGAKLSEAMAKHPGVFSELYVNTVLAGEAGGALDKVLLRLATVLEEENETRTSIKAALRYPIMVMIALFVAVFILSVFVVPQFTKIYIGMNVTLPLPTRIMMWISVGFRKYWYILFPALGGLIFAVKTAINIPQGRKLWDTLKFQIPAFGIIYTKIVMLRFASMLNVLYQAGLPILHILDIVKITIGNVILAEEVDSIKREVADGKGVSGGILNSKLFPKLVGYMISIGEKSGSLSTMLDSLCEYYTMEVKTALKNLASLIEPIMTGVLGTVIMGMALAIFLPMWEMISVIKRSAG